MCRVVRLVGESEVKYGRCCCVAVAVALVVKVVVVDTLSETYEAMKWRKWQER